MKPEKQENNIVSLGADKKKKSPKIFSEEDNSTDSNEELLTLTNEAEPLILTNEIKKEKDSSVKNIKEKFSPAVRKMVVENNIDSVHISLSHEDNKAIAFAISEKK